MKILSVILLLAVWGFIACLPSAMENKSLTPNSLEERRAICFAKLLIELEESVSFLLNNGEIDSLSNEEIDINIVEVSSLGDTTIVFLSYSDKLNGEMIPGSRTAISVEFHKDLIIEVGYYRSSMLFSENPEYCVLIKDYLSNRKIGQIDRKKGETSFLGEGNDCYDDLRESFNCH